MTWSVPLPLDVPVAVIVTVPVVPPRVPAPDVELVVLMAIIEELPELQFAATEEVKLMVVPAPPFAERLMVFPDVQEVQVIVTVCAPTVTLVVPLTFLYDAVTVIAEVVF